MSAKNHRTTTTALSFFLAGLAAFGADTGWKTLRGCVIPATSRLVAKGSLPATNELRLVIGLPLRDAAGLDQFLADVGDPISPRYRQYLTPEQFTARFGPTEQDYAAVKNFARTNGFSVVATHDDRLLLDVRAEVKDIRRAFHVNLRAYKHPTEARDFFAPDAEPVVAAALPVVAVQGLSDYARPQPWVRKAGGSAKAFPKGGSSPDGNGAYFGDDFRKAYASGTALTGAGQMVGLLEFDGFNSNDIAAYAAAAGGGRTNIIIQTVLLNGATGTPSGSVDGSMEISADIEMAMAMAPGLSKIVVFEAPDYAVYFDDLLSSMAASNAVGNLSCSWGGAVGVDAASEISFKKMAAQGQSFFNATADTDAFVGAIPFPSESPSITQVGGTTLASSSTGAWLSESVWNPGNGVGSSGGSSTNYSIPIWQQGVGMTACLGSPTQRNVPDVAMTADNVYIYYNHGSSNSIGGTSCAAPLWAGFVALANQQAAANALPPVGFINPAIYAIGNGGNYTSCFHDITSGNNFWSGSPADFPAVAGYDLCTGWGTPAGSSLISALAIPAPVFTTFSRAANAFVFAWNALPGVAYQVQCSTNLASTNWTVLNTVTATAAAASYTNIIGGETQRYFRIRRLP